MPLPGGPGVAISVDYFGPLPVTPRGNTYILLITNRFSCRADMFPVTAAEFIAEATANILVNKYIPSWGCPRPIGQQAPVPLKAFTSCIPAVGSVHARHKLLPS